MRETNSSGSSVPCLKYIPVPPAPEELEKTAHDWAKKLVQLPQNSVRTNKALIRRVYELAGYSEVEAFKLIYKDFMQANPNKKTWQDVFQVTFNMSISDFYTKVSSYKPSINTVLPSTSLTLESIFN